MILLKGNMQISNEIRLKVNINNKHTHILEVIEIFEKYFKFSARINSFKYVIS